MITRHPGAKQSDYSRFPRTGKSHRIAAAAVRPLCVRRSPANGHAFCRRDVRLILLNPLHIWQDGPARSNPPHV